MSPTQTTDVNGLAADLAVDAKTIRRMLHRGRLPAPVGKINGRGFRWLKSDILLWLESGMPLRADFERIKADPKAPKHAEAESNA